MLFRGPELQQVLVAEEVAARREPGEQIALAREAQVRDPERERGRGGGAAGVVVEPAADDAFEAAITDAEGRELWSGPIQGSEYGTFLLGIPRPFLEAGSYRIVLYALTGDRRQPIETYALELASGAG